MAADQAAGSLAGRKQVQGWGARSNPLVWLESEMTLEF
jgi:hypothetical protein